MRVLAVFLMLVVGAWGTLLAEESAERADQVGLLGPSEPYECNQALDALVQSFEFFDTPLTDVLAEISESHEVTILIDDVALESLGLDSSEPITFSCSAISLRSALASVLRPLDLVAVPRPIGIVVTSEDEAIHEMVTAVYGLGNLLDELPADDLLGAIEHTVCPDSWEDVGGPGVVGIHNRLLVVSQTDPTHREIMTLLKVIEQQFQRPGTGPIEVTDDEDVVQNLEAAMSEPVEVEFFETPLEDCVQYLTEIAQIPFYVDQESLDALGLDSSEPITLSLRDKPLRHIVDWMLQPLDLTWVIRDEAIWIISEDDATEALTLRLYPINQAEAMQDMLVEVIQPETWETQGGHGSMAILGDMLAVRQTRAVHRAIEAVLKCVASPKEADQTAEDSEMRVYCISDEWNSTPVPLESLAHLIQRQIEPVAWKDERYSIEVLPGRLLIVATPSMHSQVSGLLRSLKVPVLPRQNAGQRGGWQTRAQPEQLPGGVF